MESADPSEAPFHDTLADGSPVVSDPEALEAAEQAAAHSAPVYFDDIATGQWVAVMPPLEFYGVLAGVNKAFAVSAPLEAAGIPFAWDPYPPDQRPSGLPGAGSYDQPFTLLVPVGSFEEARVLVEAALEAEAETRDTDDHIDDPAALEAAEQAVHAGGPCPAAGLSSAARRLEDRRGRRRLRPQATRRHRVRALRSRDPGRMEAILADGGAAAQAVRPARDEVLAARA